MYTPSKPMRPFTRRMEVMTAVVWAAPGGEMTEETTAEAGQR